MLKNKSHSFLINELLTLLDNSELPSALKALKEKHAISSDEVWMPIEEVNEEGGRRVFIGCLSKPTLKKGQRIIFSPSAKKGRVETVREIEEGKVALTLQEQVAAEKGQVLSLINNQPTCSNEFIASVFCFPDQNFQLNKKYTLTINSQETMAEGLKQNDNGDIVLKTDKALAFKRFSEDLTLGCFVLCDGDQKVACCSINESVDEVNAGIESRRSKKSKNTYWEVSSVTHYERILRQGHEGCVIWMTGLPSAGKSTLGDSLERHLFDLGYRSYRLDGDNIRHGLCDDLAFSPEDRKENIRRVGEVCKLLLDAGMIVIASFVSPYEEDRNAVRKIIPEGKFYETFIDCSLEECQKRDTKGLYKKAAEGIIKNMTGVSSPFEIPNNPEIHVGTENKEVHDCVSQIVDRIQADGIEYLKD